MARNRTPTAQLEASGAFVPHPERKRARQNEPAPHGALGDAPKGLTKEEKVCWNELVAMTPDGVLTAGDAWTAEIAVRLMVKLRDGSITVGETAQLISCLSRMGLTPADRSKISVPEQPGSKLDKFLERKQAVQ